VDRRLGEGKGAEEGGSSIDVSPLTLRNSWIALALILFYFSRPESTIVTVASSSGVKLTGCQLYSGIEHDHVILSLSGPTSVSNSSVSCGGQLYHPRHSGMSLRHFALPSDRAQLQQLTVWSHVTTTTAHAIRLTTHNATTTIPPQK